MAYTDGNGIHYSEFDILALCFARNVESAIGAEESAANPCPDYVASLESAAEQIRAARSVADLARVDWIQGEAMKAAYP